MNKEEITKEAQEQVNYCTPIYSESFIQGYLAGAEPREKRIAELEVQCDCEKCYSLARACRNDNEKLKV